MIKQIEAPSIPMILSNSGNKIAKMTKTALTPILIINLPRVLIVSLNLLALMVETPNKTSKVEIIGLAFNGVLANGIIQINPLING